MAKLAAKSKSREVTKATAEVIEKKLQSDSLKSESSNFIKEIYVEKLFGHYTYTLSSKEGHDLSRLFILYGDNGSGKTTILKTLFNLISTKDKSGFKSKIAKTTFAKFNVEFGNGITIGADRKEAVFGSYKLFIARAKQIIHQIEIKTDEDGDVRFGEGTEEYRKLRVILRYINQLKISVFYLADDRKLFHSFEGQVGVDERESDDNIYIRERVNKILARRREEQDKVEIENAADRFTAWVRDKVIAGSKSGDTTAVSIYTDVIKNINKIEPLSADSPKQELVETIRELSQKSNQYAKFGLIDNYEYQDIIDVFSKVRKSDKVELIYRITKPFFESIEARLEALEGLQKMLESFIGSINEYFSRKTFDFNLTTGFKITHEKGGKLFFTDLSSGEKQLLLLFINTITASEDATVFIIDEPEISLNIKWQRKLLKTLLEFSRNRNVQFIIATHSIELLASNLKNVVKIEE